MTVLKRAILFLVMMAGLARPASAESNSNPTLDRLVQRARQMRLAEERTWRLLLHYHRHWPWGTASDAKGKDFFNSPVGKTDPQAELEATLAAFFTPPMDDPARQHPQCRFVARYHWLKEVLRFDPRELPEQKCERYRAWRETLDPESITLIFPSAFMNNPSSMFGHTLFRIDRMGRRDEDRLLDYTLNYAADVNTANGLLFAILGLTGGFQGRFSTIPYYLKVQMYGDIENRDIWEYRLRLGGDATNQMLRHAWELGNTSFPYYFLKRNCSYELLTLLEVGDPRLHLSDRFWLYAIPSDTVRVLIETGLTEEPVYRPSRSRQIAERASQLKREEWPLLRRIMDDDAVVHSEAFGRLSIEREALVLDIASDWMIYRSTEHPDRSEQYKKAFRRLLIERSALGVQTPPLQIEQRPAPPEEGHDTARIGAAFGFLGRDPFEEISIRPAYHDLMAADVGYTYGSEIDFLSGAVRYYNDERRAALDRLSLLRIVSLFPIDELFQKPSWKLDLGVSTARDIGCARCNFYNANVGLGLARRSWLPIPVLAYAFAEADANYGEVFAEKHRAGGGVTGGAYIDPLPRWRIHLSATYRTYPLGDRSSYSIGTVQQRYTLSRNLEIRLALHQYKDDREGMISLFAYF